MRAFAFVFVALSGLTTFLFPTTALAGNFSGVCTLSGTATLQPGLGAALKPATFAFNTDGSSINHCSGQLNGVKVVNAQASAVATGKGKLSCAASEGTGTGTLTINGVPIRFNLTIVGTGPQVTLALKGHGGGNGAGQASFATDNTAAGQCLAQDAESLTFVIAAAAEKLNN